MHFCSDFDSLIVVWQIYSLSAPDWQNVLQRVLGAFRLGMSYGVVQSA